ncbi:MAG: AraC family ligand binding domain-containing protein [Myxococcales bacterium]|nr:AraC family ligand binding domain-containing protein [Myxococcales bacterium]
MLRALLLISAGLTLIACSPTAPVSVWPPPGPRDGLPFIPLPEESDEPAEQSTPTQAEPAPAVVIDGSLPAAPPAALARTHACKDKQCKLTKVLPDPAFAKTATGGQDSPGTMWLEELGPGSIVTLPRDHELELFAVALAGDALGSGDDGGAVKLETWGALRAPGLGISIKAGKEGAKLVLGVAAKNGTLATALERLEKKAFEVRWRKRPAPLAQVALGAAKDLSFAHGSIHARIAFGGEPPIPGSWAVLSSSKTAEIKLHDHPTWEHLAVLAGAGTMQLAGKDHAVEPGVVFDIAPGEKHGFVPSGSSGLLVIQMYTPSGPEQRFVKLAEAEAAPPAEPKK